jgi:outer membrane protein assembly factor BamD (BamD/ComL family)
MKAALLALSITLWAPYQCATEPNERPQEDSAPKALWMLAEKFEQEGNSSARETTLHQLIEQYPSSRYAERARANMGMPSGRTEKYAGDEEKAQKERDENEAKENKAADAKPKNPESGDE